MNKYHKGREIVLISVNVVSIFKLNMRSGILHCLKYFVGGGEVYVG